MPSNRHGTWHADLHAIHNWPVAMGDDLLFPANHPLPHALHDFSPCPKWFASVGFAQGALQSDEQVALEVVRVDETPLSAELSSGSASNDQRFDQRFCVE